MPALSFDVSPQGEPLATLRTITFANLLDRDPIEMTKLIRACEEVGFFYLKLTCPGSQNILQNLEELSSTMREWFSQDEDTKLKTATISNSHGYKPLGQHAGIGATRDGWEALKIGSSELSGRWALPSVVRDRAEKFSEFHSECHYVTKILLDCISSKLGLLGQESLQQYHRNDAPSKSSLFFIHYPAMDLSQGSLGQNQHTDIGSLTLLFAQQWGLQVLCPVNFVCPETGERLQWRSVEPRPGHAIVNVGDTLRFLSGQKLRSALHRAMPLDGVGRYSVAYFLRPSDDSEFRDSRGQATTAVGWYLKKNETYESHAAQDEAILTGGIKKIYSLDTGRV
ncbi:hypothetical protein KVR01_000905 [Diaporthe batatas]|uniref:uncharacterized protein n=1 Tax=Diaporthe batatas TaxID=748121 RepID=UPI001D04D9D5|nr:uncharacterized protein KVR01_000905 [Diaporthe batatas]KAG8170160.1 hypothetical protein KVR01_000905 [Diaporthe batatas]